MSYGSENLGALISPVRLLPLSYLHDWIGTREFAATISSGGARFTIR